jgi:DNA-binding NarL/FixJ family response regulator
MNPIRILIADDHPMFRFGLRALLAAEADTEVLGEATNGQEAVSLAASLKPDLILMDINLPPDIETKPPHRCFNHHHV